ncbi:MAG: FlgO family outer membrane protein [Acidobacteriota bacterium]|nr:FlgO family outer membrane protein [Acidobacteriota bacterium]
MTIAADTKFGRYEVRRKIGAGGMGEVYLATDNRLERNIALKVLPAEFCCDAERVRRFKQEARAASALNHPNIITIHEIGEVDDRLFIATEFIDGETLREKIRKNDLTVYESVKIAEQVAAGLSAAHQAHIIHRDIKPENIMIRRDGYVKILDFGLAKLADGKPEMSDAEAETQAQVNTRPGMIMGSVNYMSPEQARGRDIDERTDVWSFGVCLYEMLVGENPFARETVSDSLAALIHIEPALLDENLPAELQRIVRKTLQKDAGKRYQTVKDLLIDLEEVKEELKFQNKLERTASPNRKETKTQILNATTTDAAHTTSSAEYIATEIRQHKRSFAIGSAVLLLAAIGLGYWFFANRSLNTKQIESIAVLPFVNDSANADNEYLSDGMTETLIGSLSQIPNLNVKARSSVFRYKGKDADPQTIGKELNVQAILNGRVAQRGEQLILNLELVDAKTENVIWSEQYTRKQADLISLQSEIARDVSSKLRTKLSGTDEQKLAKNYTENTEAYKLYLQGRFYWNKRSPEGLRKAIEYFKQAIALDPNYALAYSGLADSYSLLPVFDSKVTRRETMPLAKEAALKALSLNDNLAEAHVSLAPILSDYDGDWAGAEQHFIRAVELNPNYPTAHQWYGEMLVREGRFDEGLAETRRALELDPFSLITNLVLGINLNAARRYDEAITQIRKTLELDPNFADANYFLFEAYANKGMYAEAVAADAKQMTLDGEPLSEVEAMKDAFNKSGWNGFLRHKINYLESRHDKVFAGGLASFYARLGEKDKAFAWLEKAYEDRDEGLTLLRVDARFDNLRDDPRFQDLLRRVGFPQ